ncbi:MAG TPA: MFS transporter [Parachlamydiaceae bacterium]|nr:MFS transporter [Parachlamydiaceae bacterium]
MNSQINSLKAYSTLGTLLISHFLVDFMIGIWLIYKTIAHLDIATMGIIAAICVFIGEALQVFFGTLSDRGYCKILIMSGLIATSICSLISCTTNYLFLFILFQITCLGSSAFHPSAIGFLSNSSGNKKGLWIALFSTSGLLGFACSQIAFAKVYVHFGSLASFLMLPTLFLAIFFFFYPFAEYSKKKEKETLSLKCISELFKKPYLTRLYFTQVCNQIVGWATIFLLPDILKAREAAEWITFGGGHLLLVLGGACAMIPSGILADKFSYRKLMLATNTLAITLFFVFLKFPFISNEFLLVLLFFIGASSLITNPLLIAFGNKLYPEEPGKVSGFLMGFAWCIANPIGLAGGALLTRSFTEDAAAKSLSVLTVFFVTSLILSYFLPETKKQTIQQSAG